jgi:anti-sigma factor RsiW
MNEHLDERQLNDFVDDLLVAPERTAVETHVEACASCRTRAAALRELQAALRTLPREIAPPASLLAAIHAGIDDAAHADRAVGRGGAPVHRPWHARPALLAAAAVVLVAVSSTTTALLLRGGADGAAVTGAVDTSAAATARLVAAHPLERSYEDAITQLEHEITTQGSALAPETRRVVEHNLEIIDRALTEARAALRADPSNAALADLLRSGYERKLDVLRSAASHVRPAS